MASKKKNILVATIGTRDLMFQATSGIWYNVGNDRLRENESITEKLEVIYDLNLSETTTYRDLTKHLLENRDRYIDRLKPVIIGKLLAEESQQIKQLYLIGTDQLSEVTQRTSDTIHTCHLIKNWAEKKYGISTTIIPLGQDGTSPANFEATFAWWRKTWNTVIDASNGPDIWLGLTGGVGQTSESGRISGLSLYGERIQFFEFHQNNRKNQAGNNSEYSGPFLGTNYLWDRTRQQALGMIDRFDYAGAKELLEPYFDTRNLGGVANLLRAGIAWNRGEFQDFLDEAKSILTIDRQQQGQHWWWMAYEQAYLAVVRLSQNNIAEAMLHSFRSIEGGLLEWAKATLGDNFVDDGKDSPIVLDSILDSHPNLRAIFKSKDKEKTERGEIEARALWMPISVQKAILKQILPTALKGDFKYFWSDDCKKTRNGLSHRLGGISEVELFKAWGDDIQDRTQWQSRILACLNILTRNSFSTLNQASLFARVHDQIRKSIEES
jgi:hypothetical protein